jgi:hypothetical protein
MAMRNITYTGKISSNHVFQYESIPSYKQTSIPTSKLSHDKNTEMKLGIEVNSVLLAATILA